MSEVKIKNIEELLIKTDWELLKKQKEWLITRKCAESQGLLHFLDSFQDMAADVYLDEETVFPKEEGESDE